MIPIMNPIEPFDARRYPQQQDQQRQRHKVMQALMAPQQPAAPMMPNPQKVMALGRNFSDMLMPVSSAQSGMTRPMKGLR